jgi:hypothetical protein
MRSGRVILAIYFFNIMALTDNLQAFYKLSDLSDSSGNNRTLTNNGNVSFASGKIGNAAAFDGTNRLSTNLNFINGRNLSVFCWVKTDNFNYNFIVSGDNSGEQWGNLMTTPDGAFRGEFYFDESYHNCSTNLVITNNEWRHIGMASSENEIKLYVDGVLAATYDTSSITGSFKSGLNTIGANWDGNFAQVIGQVDAVGYWNRALSDAEVAELYNSGTGIELEGSAAPTLVKMQAPVKFFGKIKFGV